MNKQVRTTKENNLKTIEKRIKLFIMTLIFAVIGIVLDQYTKYLAVIHLKDQQPFVIIDGVFELQYLENRGAAFGMLQNKQIFFIISVAVITLAIIWFLFNVPIEKRFFPLQLCAAVILSGAFGNCIDRVKQGFVVDFLYFKLIDFPIFNVADIYVTVAAILLVILLFWYYKEEDLERIFHSGK
ncbi:MAG: signal peptidase II [Lachnospiraceae bacterium]